MSDYGGQKPEENIKKDYRSTEREPTTTKTLGESS